MVTTYFKNLAMNNIFNTGATAPLPIKYYLALSTVTPPNDGVGNGFAEPNVSTGYTRIEITGLADSVGGLVTNSANLSFLKSTANQGIITAYGIYDALTGGNLMIYNALASSRTIEEGTILSIQAGELDFTLSGI